MADINEEEMTGDLLPDVYIEKITLENSGFFPTIDDPHIDNERETIDLPQPPDTLKITINLVVKQIFENETIGRWLSEIDFKKYFRIKIFETQDARVSSLLELTKDVAVALDPATFSFAKPSVIRLMQGYFGKNRYELQKDIQKNVKIKHIDLTNVQTQQEAQTKKETLDDGTEVVNTYFTISFEYPKSNIGHLAYYCMSQFDFFDLIRDFRIRPTKKLYEYLIGLSKVSSQIVFDDFLIKTESFVYISEDSKVWTGDIHQNEDGEYRTGIAETVDSAPLIRREVSNSVIQDFRRRRQIQRTNFDFNPVKKYFEKFQTKNLSTNTNYLAKRNSFFGDIDISVDQDGDAKIKFSVNFKTLIFENSKYGFLIDNHNSRLANEIITRARFKSIKMFRQRVKPENAASVGLTIGRKYAKFSKDEKRELMFHSSKNEGIIVDSERFLFRRINGINYPQILDFTGLDKTASELTDGLYCYSLEFELEDPFVDYFKSLIVSLQEARALLLPYYVESQKLSYNKFFEEVSDPHINSPREEDRVGTLYEGNYDTLTNAFTESFKIRMSERYENLTDAPWILSSVIYADILNIFVPSLDEQELVADLVKFASPETGNPSGISTVIKSIEQLITNISNLLGIEQVSNNFLSSATSSTKTMNTFVVEHYFYNNAFDANNKGEVFVNYLQDAPAQEKNGTLTIQGADFRRRIDQEMQKYFNSTNPSMTTNAAETQIEANAALNQSKFSFLTPVNMVQGSNTVSLGATEDQKEISKINNMISILEAGSSRDTMIREKIDTPNIGTSVFNNEMQKNFNLIIREYVIPKPPPEPVEVIIEEPFLSEEIKELQAQLPQAISIEKAKEVVNLVKKPVAPIINAVLSIKTQIDCIDDVYSGRINSSWGLNKKYQERTRQSKIEKIIDKTLRSDPNVPPQFKAAALKEANYTTSTDIIPVKTQDNIEYSLNREKLLFGSTKQIMMLTGYQIGENGQLLINKPRWEKLTEEKYSQIPPGVEIVCKFFDINDINNNACDPSKKGKVADDVFILVAEPSNTGVQQPILPEKYEIKIPTPAPQLLIPQNIRTLKKQQLVQIAQPEPPKINISKKILDRAIRVDLEQKTYPRAFIKNNEVSKKTIEQVISSAKIVDKIKEKQEVIKQQSTSKPVILAPRKVRKTRTRR